MNFSLVKLKQHSREGFRICILSTIHVVTAELEDKVV